jgi:hypothetical protein
MIGLPAIDVTLRKPSRLDILSQLLLVERRWLTLADIGMREYRLRPRG